MKKRFRGLRGRAYVIFKGGSSQMLTFDDKGGRGVRKTPKPADVIYEWSLGNNLSNFEHPA